MTPADLLLSAVRAAEIRIDAGEVPAPDPVVTAGILLRSLGPERAIAHAREALRLLEASTHFERAPLRIVR